MVPSNRDIWSPNGGYLGYIHGRQKVEVEEHRNCPLSPVASRLMGSLKGARGVIRGLGFKASTN